MEIKIKDLITDKIPGEWGEEVIDGNGINVIRTANFTNLGNINFSNIVQRKIDQKKIDQKQLKQGDVIIEKSGGSPTQPVGRVVYFDLVTDEIYLCNNFTAVLRPDKFKIYPRYFFYQLFIGYIRGKTLKYQNKTTGIINLKLDNYINEKIFVPSRKDQIRIVEVLTKVETLIQQRKESIILLENFLRSTFLDMFGDPVKNEKKWVKTSVGKYTDCIVPGRDKPKSFSGNIPWIKTEDLNNKSFFNKSKENIGLTLEEITNVRGKIIPSNSVIMTCVGQLNIISINKVECIINQQLHSFQCHRELNNIFLMFALGFEERFMHANASKTTVAYMNKSICNSIPIIVPPIKFQNKFATIVEKAEKVKEHHKESLKELENLFGSLSQKAFKGELDLSKLDVSAQMREVEKKIKAESILDISLETKLSKSMQQFIKQTADIQKSIALANNMIPKALFEQIESINKIASPFQNLKSYQIPESLSQAMKSFDGIKSITSQLNQEAKEQFKTKLTWEEVNFEMVANWIKEEYSEYYFNSEILINFLESERVVFSNYHSSEELKTNPKLNEADDIKSFVFSALKGKNQFIKLEQFFYDAVNENIQLNLRHEDYEVIKDKGDQLRSGVYFKVIE
ncbi:restriction endonuclease subunit S [Chryseobacterium sp. KCF3-3]|uniref:restriction endonuclease subunit S n=1 Tax=Chryseobacterium sp. KCF3-3 TaxID=3231511 RepID=UPI0038B351CB